MQPSNRQLDIYRCWENEDCNILIRAVAGSGKTTTLMELLKLNTKKTLFVAFNKSIQMEIEERIIRNRLYHARSMTMHSLGLAAIKRKVRVNISSSKSFKMALEVEKKNKDLYQHMDIKEKQAMTMCLVNMNEVSRMFLTDDVTKISHQMVMLGRSMVSDKMLDDIWAKFLKLREKSYQGRTITIDFVDMIYLPVKNKWIIPFKPEYLMVDEAQDLNLAQHMLLDQLIGQGHVKKWIAVGDPKQSIYGFSGAFASSFELFLEKGNVKELPLDICYRCPQLVLKEANEVYDVMEGFKQEEGVVDKKGVGDLDGIPKGSLVICRNSGPLVSIFFYLLVRGRSVNIKGDDILDTIKRFLNPYKKMTLDDALKEMQRDYSKLVKKYMESEKHLDKYLMNQFQENMDNYKTIYNNLNRKLSYVYQIPEYMEKFVNGDPETSITLCTIHKSKGLENGTVYILNEDLIPSQFARTKEQLVQEENLRYVARTRASEKLFYLNISKKDLKNIV